VAVALVFAEWQPGLVAFAKVQNAKPLSRWEPLQLETFAQELKPVVDAYSKVKRGARGAWVTQ